MKIRNLMVLIILFLGFSGLTFSQMQDVEWEDKRTASVVILNTSYDEIWEQALDILLFEKFKMRGSMFKSIHEAITVEKNTGLIVVKGSLSGYPAYMLKISVNKKNDCIVVKAQSTGSGRWKKRPIEKFFQLLKESEEKR